MKRRLSVSAGLFVSVVFLFSRPASAGPLKAVEPRREMSLDGAWKIAQAKGAAVPRRFDRTVPVPGLADMASPPFERVGFKSERRDAFWYRRTFRVAGPVPPSAFLRIAKAKYGMRVLLNGAEVGESTACFTAVEFDVRGALKGNGAMNELLVRVGAFRDSVPPGVPSGWDFEKYRYIPGIYDSVSLILTGSPRIENVQVVPLLEEKKARVIAYVRGSGRIPVTFTLRDPNRKGSSVTVRAEAEGGEGKKEIAVKAELPVPGCVFWSPENPHLYEVTAATGADAVRVRFGMRSFRCDPASGRAVLNGRPYFMRGTNVCVFRFFEDASRGDRPWRREWVRRLHEKFKNMHWNSIRYCIGFPPESWYEIADEVGFLIQDEYPIWFLGHKNWPRELTADSLVPVYKRWLSERWNHPCVVIWDAQNESVSGGVTREAIKRVRAFDLSKRPWDNGWDRPAASTDVIETHPYLFIRLWHGKGEFTLRDLARTPPRPPVRGSQRNLPNPLLINEYGWLWLTREGDPTCLTVNVYRRLLGSDSTAAERRVYYARTLAALTEFWRCHRECAGVLHFCGLGYSRPGDKPRPEGGATSDHFVDLESLQFEPNFERYVRDAFSPVGLMIDRWEKDVTAGAELTVPVVCINDLYKPWSGRVTLSLVREEKVIASDVRSCEIKPLGKTRLSFTLSVPSSPGPALLAAELRAPDGRVVRSLRDIAIAEKK